MHKTFWLVSLQWSSSCSCFHCTSSQVSSIVLYRVFVLSRLTCIVSRFLLHRVGCTHALVSAPTDGPRSHIVQSTPTCPRWPRGHRVCIIGRLHRLTHGARHRHFFSVSTSKRTVSETSTSKNVEISCPENGHPYLLRSVFNAPPSAVTATTIVISSWRITTGNHKFLQNENLPVMAQRTWYSHERLYRNKCFSMAVRSCSTLSQKLRIVVQALVVVSVHSTLFQLSATQIDDKGMRCKDVPITFRCVHGQCLQRPQLVDHGTVRWPTWRNRGYAVELVRSQRSLRLQVTEQMPKPFASRSH